MKEVFKLASAKIEIVGQAEKEPKINEDETVELKFKISMSDNASSGLKSQGTSYYLVNISPQSWSKVSDSVKNDSIYIINGESKASVTSKGVPFIKVNCIDIALKNVISNQTASLQAKKAVFKSDNIIDLTKSVIEEYDPKITTISEESKPPEYDNNNDFDKPMKIEKENNTWYDVEEIIYVNIKDIVLTDAIHLNTKSLKFFNVYKAVSSQNIPTPLAVRPYNETKYSLVMGFKGYLTALIAGISKVPIVIRNMSHDELVKELKYNDSFNKDDIRVQNYSSLCEVKLSEIKIPEIFKEEYTNKEKIKFELLHYTLHERFSKPVYLLNDNLLKDGFAKYIAAKKLNLESITARYKIT